MATKALKKVYLAIPYSGMEESSYEQSWHCAAHFMQQGGLNIFAPIIHSHVLHAQGGLAGDWSFWSEVDYQYLEWADELWILVPEEGYDKVLASTGVCAEFTHFKRNFEFRPVRFLTFTNHSYYFLDSTMLELPYTAPEYAQ